MGYMVGLLTHNVKCDTFDLIAGYLPKSNVMEHLRLDLDQRDFEDFLKSGNFNSASDIYVNGGNSMKSMKIMMKEPLNKDFDKGSMVEQGGAKGILIANAKKGGDTLKVSVTSKCFGKFSKTQDRSGCFSEIGGVLKIDDGDVKSGIDVKLPYRTLAGFSVAAESKMKGQKMFEMYKAYYGASDYADKFIKAALKGEDETKRVNVPMNFLGKEDIFRIECAKKGAAYWSVWMYVIREMEDAITDCKSGCEFCNDAPVHAWDEAVAFYTGSLEGKSGDMGGKMLYRLAEKRCKNYQTCKGATSNVNKEILRYAYKIARGDGTPKEKAEGVAFLGAIIPQLHSCSHSDAGLVMQHMWIDGDIDYSADGFKTVKEAFQRNYACMGVSCADIGGHLDDLTDDFHADFRPCTDGVTPTAGQAQMSAPWIMCLVLFAMFYTQF